MPVYDFHNEESGKTISVLVPLHASDKERAQQRGGDGKIYRRVFAAPLAAKDTRMNDGTLADFRRTTSDKNLKVGEMWQISKEASEKRKQMSGGEDPVQEKFYQDYEKTTHGKHADVKKRETEAATRKVMDAFGIKVIDD